MTPAIDDDAQWISIEAAHQQRAAQIDNNALAVIDLMEALKHGRLPCMARPLDGGERKLVAVAAWTDQIGLDFGMTAFGEMKNPRDGLRVAHRRQPGENIVRLFRGWAFYVGKQAFGALWSAKLTNDSDEAPHRRQGRTPRGKVGRPPVLTLREIKAGRAMVRRAAREHRLNYPGQKLKISAALGVLRKNMKRDGKLIVISNTVWKEQAVWPVLRPNKTDNN